MSAQSYCLIKEGVARGNEAIKHVVTINLIAIAWVLYSIPCEQNRILLWRGNEIQRSITNHLVSTTVVGLKENAYRQVVGRARIGIYGVASRILDDKSQLTDRFFGCRPAKAHAAQRQLGLDL